MASFNRIILVGNLTKDPDFKQIGSGQSVCRLSLASNRKFKNKQTGAPVEEVCFVDVDVWGAQAESAHQFLQKGRPVLVEGRLKYDTWKDAEGNNRNRHSIAAERIVFLGSRQDGDEKNGYSEADLGQSAGISSSSAYEPESSAHAARKKRSTASTEFKDVQPFEDDLPF